MPDFTNAALCTLIDDSTKAARCTLIDDATMYGDDTFRRVGTMTRERGYVLELSCLLFL